MEIEVVRIGQRVVRDDRVTTHVALVARSFGANKIYMNEVNSEIEKTISDINKTWGGNFQIEIISEWKQIIKERKNAGVKIVHLTMYGQNINNVQMKIRNEDKILIVVGAEKVPREIYEIFTNGSSYLSINSNNPDFLLLISCFIRHNIFAMLLRNYYSLGIIKI